MDGSRKIDMALVGMAESMVEGLMNLLGLVKSGVPMDGVGKKG